MSQASTNLSIRQDEFWCLFHNIEVCFSSLQKFLFIKLFMSTMAINIQKMFLNKRPCTQRNADETSELPNLWPATLYFSGIQIKICASDIVRQRIIQEEETSLRCTRVPVILQRVPLARKGTRKGESSYGPANTRRFKGLPWIPTQTTYFLNNMENFREW